MLIIIDEVPLSKNSSGKPKTKSYKKGYVNMHWAERREYKKRIYWLIYEQKSFFYKSNYMHNLPYAKAKITFDIFFKCKRTKRDIQNYLGGGLIAWLDVLVDLKFIKDDNYNCIGQPQVTFNIDKEFPRTEIRIERRE